MELCGRPASVGHASTTQSDPSPEDCDPTAGLSASQKRHKQSLSPTVVRPAPTHAKQPNMRPHYTRDLEAKTSGNRFSAGSCKTCLRGGCQQTLGSRTATCLNGAWQDTNL